MTWSRNGTPNTLSSSNTTVNISDLTASEFNVRLFHGFGTGGNVYSLTRLNGNSGNNYAWRRSINGGADSDFGSQQNMAHDPQNTNGLDELGISYWINIDGEEKLMISFWTSSGASGAGTAPSRAEAVGKFNDGSTNPQVTQISVLTTYGGSYDTNSNETALNGDTTLETILGSNVQSGSRFEATDTRKIYYLAPTSVTFEDDFSSYADISAGNAVWVSENTSYSYVDVTGDRLIINQPYSTTIHAYVAKDFGANVVSTSSWVARWKMRITSQGVSTMIAIGFSDTNHTVSTQTVGDHISLQISQQATPDHVSLASDNNAFYSAGTTVSNSFYPATNTDYWYELIRNGSTATINIYSDSTYSTLVGTASRTITTTNDLRYFKIANIDWDVTTSAGDYTALIDDFKFYNGVTSPTDLVWTEEV